MVNKMILGSGHFKFNFGEIQKLDKKLNYMSH